MGVPSLVSAKRHAGPGLRAAHFATALVDAGHQVLLLAVVGEDEDISQATSRPESTDGVTVEFLFERDLFSRAQRARIERFAPQAVVGATVYAASLAARLRLAVPLWADVFGDLMAEAQAKAVRTESDWSLVHFWTLLRDVLENADRFSAVSEAQAHALVGQLGLAGRLSARTAGDDLVATIPCAAPPARKVDRRTARRELGYGDSDFVLLASGGVNTWCDVQTLCRGVAEAMRADPRVRLLVTGGGIPGHDDRSHAELLQGLVGLDVARVKVLGWVDSDRLPIIYAASDLALHIEKNLYERRLGAENRVVEWLANGLPCVTTAQSETGRLLVEEGLALRCELGDGADLASVIREAAVESRQERATANAGGWEVQTTGMGRLGASAVRGRAWVIRERGLGDTARPLLEWCQSPRFASDRDGARFLRLGLISHPQSSLEMLEAYVAGLSLREVVRRGTRWVVRRLWASVGAAARRATPPPVNETPPLGKREHDGLRRQSSATDASST